MRESAFEKFIAYWEGIATNHKEIKDFYYLDEDEIISGALRNRVQYPCLMLEYIEPKVQDNMVNAPLRIPSGCAVLISCQPSNEAEIKAALIKTEKIILAIISKLRKDRAAGAFFVNSNNLSYSKVGKMFTDNCYGWRLDFAYDDWIDLSYDAAEWNEGF